MRSASSLIVRIGIVAAPLVVSAAARSTAAEFPWEGEVTGTNVYVRSGAGPNWYPTTKLNTGDRVVTLGEKYGWYQIAPPAGAFSYVDKAMVDRQNGSGRGVVRQDRVYVRAGSVIEKRKSATQVVLNKGDAVHILGEDEGFYKIAPPPGASLYISKQYVRPVEPRLTTGLVQKYLSANPSSAAAQAPRPPPAAERTAVAPAPSPGDARNADASAPGGEHSTAPGTEAADDGFRIPVPADAAAAAPAGGGPDAMDATVSDAGLEPTPAPVAGGTPAASGSDATSPNQESPSFEPVGMAPAQKVEPTVNKYQATLNILESELVAMLDKPLEQQDPASLRQRYEELAAQEDEYVVSEVAKIRVRQLRERQSLIDGRLSLREERRELEEYRARMDSERMRIMRRRTEQAMEKYDLEGELRRSFAFAPEQRRYRLVDPASGETIAYVDVPRSVSENVEHLIGRTVGIRAAGKSFSPSARVPIAVAGSIVDLSPRLLNQPTTERPSAGPKDPTDSLQDAAKPEPGKDESEKTAAAGETNR